MSFYDYMMQKHKGKDTPAGDFAEDMSRCRDTFPIDSTERKEIQEYLIRHNACPECMDVFRKCWKQYMKQEEREATR